MDSISMFSKKWPRRIYLWTIYVFVCLSFFLFFFFFIILPILSRTSKHKNEFIIPLFMNIWCWFFMINSTNQFDFLKDNKFYQFFLDSFNLWSPLLMITHYYQTKTSIDLWCRRRLNLKSLIQSSKNLRVKLIRTHKFYQLSKLTKCKFGTSWKFQLIFVTIHGPHYTI